MENRHISFCVMIISMAICYILLIPQGTIDKVVCKESEQSIEWTDSISVEDTSSEVILPEERHIIQKDETLWGLANLYGTTSRKIKERNKISGNIIVVGNELIIPERIYFITKENLSRQISNIDTLLDAIYIAEGGDSARVPYGATGFYDSGAVKFSHARMQQIFELLQHEYPTTKGTSLYYRLATSATVLFYWELYAENFSNKYLKDKPLDVQLEFIRYLSNYYAPDSANPLNKNWKSNVIYYYTATM